MKENNPSPTKLLFNSIGNILDTYAAHSCPCGFPRFRQIVSIDCIEMGLLFTCRETETFITLCRERDLYSIEDIEADFQDDTEYWTCRVCGSRFLWGWSDAETRIDRQYLKPVSIRVEDCGASPAKPLPLYGGFFGKSLPGSSMWLQVGPEDLEKYFVQP